MSPPQGKLPHLLARMSGARRVLEADSDDPRVEETRALFEAVAAEPLLSATAIQTVGAKKWNGFLIAVVDG